MKTLIIGLMAVWMASGAVFAGNVEPGSDTRLTFRYLGVNDGLSQNSVTSILQGPDGRMLIATYDGLNFFDGYTIRSERHAPGREGGLANNRIVCMHLSADSTIWMGCDGGVMRYDPVRDCYTDYTDRLGGELRKVRSICQDASGVLWIGHEGGVIRATPDSAGGYSFVAAAGLEGLEVNAIAEDRRGVVWIGTSSGLYACTPAPGGSRPVRLAAPYKVRSVDCDAWGVLWVGHQEGIAVSGDGNGFAQVSLPGGKAGVTCTIRDREDHLWVGCATDGIWSLTLDGAFRVVASEHYSRRDFFGRISDDDISCLTLDRSGVLWAGSRRGVNYAPTAGPDFYTFKPLVRPTYTELGYDGQHINTLFVDASGKLWINTFKGATYRYDFRSDRLEDLSAQITPHSLARILQTADGTFWMAAQEGIYRVEERSGGFSKSRLDLPGIPHDVASRYRYFLDLCEDGDGNLWIATMNGLIRYEVLTGRSVTYTQAHGLASGSVYSLLADKADGVIWAGTADNGLSRIRYRSDTSQIEVETLRQGAAANSLSDNHIWCLRMARDGVIWIGTDAGLNRMQTRNGEIVSVGHVAAPYLEEVKILAITEDLAGDLWLNGSQGLYRYTPSSGRVKRFLCDDGLQSNTWTEGAAVSDNGWIFVGGINGVNYFDPSAFREDLYAGTPLFTELRILGQRIEAGSRYEGRVILERGLDRTQRLRLDYRQNNFTIGFTCDQYANPTKNLYRYKLEGYDKEWIEVGAGQRFASYTRLPAGHYVFRLVSSNGDEVWSTAERSLEIDLRPAPWASWWAYLLYALAAVGAVVAGVSHLTARQRWRRKLFMQQIEQEKTREMSEMKLGFYTNITHELRTPLALITAPLKDLEEHGIGDEFVVFRLGLIRRNVNKLLKLINQLLEIRRVSAQNLPLRVSCFDLAFTLREVVQSFGSIGERTGILMHFDAPRELPETWFDRDKIEKVLQNLISNAYKFTPERGDIHVSLAVEQHNGTRYAVVSVRDSGVGIPASDLHRIFDLFFHRTPLNGESSGVRLSFSKALVELHGGRIDVRSQVGAGSLFTIRFPVDRAAYTDAQVDAPADAPLPSSEPVAAPADDSGKKHLVLIVEDNEDMRAYITDCLKAHFRTAVAGDGETGLTMAQRLRPDVVITDLMMPVLDGVGFTRRMKENARTNFIPIIVHSVKQDRESIREALAAGAQEYIVKPFEAENLVCRIHNLLSAREHFARKLRSETITEPSAVELPSDDEQLLRRLTSVVEANMQNPLFDIEHLAVELHMSRMQLYRRMQRIAGGKNVSEVIRDMRIKRAAQLLASGGMRVSEVMMEVGMNNQYRFSKYFQEAYNMTPKEYILLHADSRKTE